MVFRELALEIVDWIHPIHHRGQWWAPVNTVMKLRIQLKLGGGGDFLTS
jgi:hypothetical protein